LIEVVTYRFNEHSEGLRLAVDYRNTAEKEAWIKRDPIRLFRDYLETQGVADAAELDGIEAEILAEVDAAVAFANESPDPDPLTAYKDIYTESLGAIQ
jgi:acetoin:2,6-dichlorophenolindophenol oxidoreductase subunit alpha